MSQKKTPSTAVEAPIRQGPDSGTPVCDRRRRHFGLLAIFDVLHPEPTASAARSPLKGSLVRRRFCWLNSITLLSPAHAARALAEPYAF
ncbi:hypothetical protein [Streptomyces sp. NPDC059906]|uniref:hypothetical protein n=1 Tax=Streptomyces sp. NPDC059906 TaxID=3346997 RepID=UPI003662465F